MKIFETIIDYLVFAKPNDIIVLGGSGIIDGFRSLEGKNDTFKVHKNTTKEKLVFTQYRAKKPLGTNNYSQKVYLLTKDEFNKLPILY